MAYYDRIAKKWHAVTGAQGGAFKRLVLNDLVIGKLSGIAGLSILELGAGNGYFLPLVLRRFSGQVPSRIVVTDQSRVLLELARRTFKVPDAEYQVLDIRASFPFADAAFDLIVANMVFNELSTAGMRRALAECGRVLAVGGRLLAAVPHPAFVEDLAARGLLRRHSREVCTMPGADGLRLPVVRRSAAAYQAALERAGFRCRAEDVYATSEVLNAKPGLRQAGRLPVAMLCECVGAAEAKTP